MVNKALLLCMVVNYVRVRQENKRQIQQLLEEHRQKKAEFFAILSMVGLVLFVAVLGLLFS